MQEKLKIDFLLMFLFIGAVAYLVMVLFTKMHTGGVLG